MKHAICVTSGTISIFLALKALGVRHGDEVIVPDITFGATAMAVKLASAKLILVDVNKSNLSFDLKKLKKKLIKKLKLLFQCIFLEGLLIPEKFEKDCKR